MPNIPTTDVEQFYQSAPLLTVPDVVATASYYHAVLGFQSDPDAVSDQYAVVWRDNAAVHFTIGESLPAGVRIFFWVKDVDRLYDDVRARGADVVVPIGTRPYHLRDFSIRDLNGVELVCGQDWDAD
jgi:predicted enzyme related to lactoylglutathione lyase